MPSLSVILPIYNVEKYLSFCLDSIRKQSLQDIEILCVLDGPTDKSSDIARKHAAQDPRIRIIEKENGGLSSARNTGIAAAAGEYLLFVDPDDYIQQNACRVLLNAFRENDADVVTFGALCVPSCNGNPWLEDCLSPEDKIYNGFHPDILFKEKSRPYVWRTAVRRNLLVDNKLFFDEKITFGEDQVFHFELYPLSKKTVFLSEKLYRYRVGREGSLMHEFSRNLELRVSKHINIVEAILRKWEERGFGELCPAELLDWTVDFLYADIRSVDTPFQHEAFRRYGSLIKEPLFKAAEKKLSPIVANIVECAIRNDVSILQSRREFIRYRIFRDGFGACIKSIAVTPLSRVKKLLKKVLPLPASSTQQYLDELNEQIRIEHDLAYSLHLLSLDSAAETSDLSFEESDRGFLR